MKRIENVKTLILFFLILFIGFGETYCQEQNKKVIQSLSLSPQYFQIKPGFSYGLVHRGLNLKVQYERIVIKDFQSLEFSAGLAFGANYNRGLGLTWHLTPIHLYKSYQIIKKRKFPLSIGPYIAANYQWQLYPELQSGHMNWLTAFELGIQLEQGVEFLDQNFKISLSSSALAVTSKRTSSPEEYFYDLQLIDFVNNAHSDLKFNLSNQYHRFHFEIELIPKRSKRLSYSYACEFVNQNFEITDKMVWNTLALKWKLGKIN